MKNRIIPGAVNRLLLQFLLITGLTTCGISQFNSEDLVFDIHRINIGHNSSSVLILDQNADGYPDVLATGGGKLTVLYGDGSGNLKLQETLPAGEHPVDLASGNLDNDDIPDLVIVNHETSYLTVFFGGREGYDTERTERLSIDVSPHPHAVEIVDLDEDGFSDIIVDDRDRERLQVYLGQGDGTFRVGNPIPVGGDPYRGMTLADITGDGHPEVITPNPRSIAIQTGDGTGNFKPLTQLDSESVPPFNTAVADFNGDGIPDIAAGSGEGPGRLMVWFGTVGGSFAPAPEAPYRIAEGPARLNTMDVNNDGFDDILVASYIGNEIAIVLGGREDFTIIREKLDDNPWDIAASDLNGDGRMDFVVANDSGTKITVLLATEKQR